MQSMVLLTFLMIISSLQAGVEDYLKKVTDKSEIHSMENIDFIYMINLDQRPEKFEQASKKLHQYGIYPYRFSAVNGWELSFETINDLGVKFEPGMQPIMGTSYLNKKDLNDVTHGYAVKCGRTYFSHCMSRGAIGIALSHLSILQDAYDSGYETIWVLEDDIEVDRDPRVLSSLIEKLNLLVGKEGWDILFTDQDTRTNDGNYVPCTGYAKRPNFKPLNPQRFATKTEVGSDFKKVGARYGAYSMIVRRSGMNKILNFIKTYKIFLPYDMEFYLPNDILIYAVKKDIISPQIHAPSDNASPAYLNKRAMLVEDNLNAE